MTFDHLSDGEFEEFIYDEGGATADQGRDIVGQRIERDVDGHVRTETFEADVEQV